MRAPSLPVPRGWGGSEVGGAERPIRRAYKSIRIPSSWIEYVYYFVIAYSVVAGYLGVEAPLVAAGMTVALAGFCCQQLRSDPRAVFAPIRFLLACTISFVFIQIVFHGVSATEPIIRTFILWICGTIIVQSLCLRRGFLPRCTFVIFAIGLIAVPSLMFDSGGSVERAKAGIELGGNLRNANGLGGWFGFCLVSFAMLGLETQRFTSRAVYWLAAVASLLVAGLSVSRGALVASAIAIILGFRGILKRGVLPLLLLIIVSVVISQSGLFEHIVSLYEERGMEETGRFLLWPHVVDRILASPLIGVGVLDLSTYIPEQALSISTPHNSYLFFALSAGIVPFAFWSLFWIRAGWKSFFYSEGLGSCRVPFFLYLFVNSMLGDISTEPWFLLACAVAAGAGGFQGRKPFRVVGRVGVHRTTPSARRLLAGANKRPGRDLAQNNRRRH